MAVVTSDFLASVLTGFRSGFSTDFAAATNLQPWRDIAMKIDSNGDTETHAWLGTPPKMVDVSKQEAQIEGLHPFSYTLTNREFEAVIEVKRSTLQDDKLNTIRPRIAQLGLEAARHPGELIFQSMISGGLAFDGVAFFADTRVIGKSGNIDNQIAGGSDPTAVANFQLQLAAARAQMRLFQDDQGRPMNLVGNTIIVPPGLEQVAYQAIAGSLSAGGVIAPVIPATATGAVEVGGYLIMVNPYLTDVNDWYLLHRNGAFRPFVYQEREAPQLWGSTDPNTEAGIIKRRFLYAVYGRYEVGYGDPRYAVKITNT